ncbi:Glu-tRNA(Gln) amidotransferase GatDE subunit E [Halobacteriales archaeon SW_7_68_16]|nr:MAG: Glu-tRNA(Gln) amidotransferase GatDE subunit E [Halobacteriales archaeon SW_7_68_16]
MTDREYEDLGLVAGLEIHQQLDTETKLFCSCPTDRRDPEASTRRFGRYLHPTRSELGEIDEAAVAESRVEREFEYLSYDTTCLVEEDDEPPRRLDAEALDVTLQIASLLDAEPVDEVHVMRKIVIDGSNTTGFQRSALVATDGEIETEAGPVGIEDLLLEEESAQRVAETDSGVRYGLDRLGVPLVEIGTDPDIRSPGQAREAAERIGMLLRSTGAVKRGIGTIRQDVNVSIESGARVEIKGVQRLDDIDDIVRIEADRQAALVGIAADLRDRDAAVDEPRDVTEVFADTDSGVVRSALDDGGRVFAVRLAGFDGIVGREIAPDRRLGTELSDHAGRSGAGGVFHTDELPAYGVVEDEVAALREAVDAGPEDAVVMVADDPETTELAIEAVADRAATAIAGVPEETRDATEDATTRYLRPLPGAARMYPETDVPPVEPDPGEIEVPELLTEKVDRYEREYDLGTDLAEQVAYGRYVPVFEDAVESVGVEPSVAATVLTSTTTELRRDGVPVGDLDDGRLLAAFEALAADDLAKEGMGDLLIALARNPDTDVATAIEEAGLAGVDEGDVRSVVQSVIERNADQVDSEGMGAFSALMGECMGELRGKADGDLVSQVLREEIRARIG